METVSTQENKSLNNQEEKNGVITVITHNPSKVNEKAETDSTSNENSNKDESDDRDQKLLESADVSQSLAERLQPIFV